MSSNLLPPTIQGPLTVLNTSVVVVGALEGATVGLFQNGSPLNRTEIADENGVAVVDLQGLELAALATVTATQSDNSGSSDPSAPPEPVMPAPNQLGPPAFLSLVHEWMDWVVVGGMIPFAEVILEYQGNVVGHAAARGGEVLLPYVSPSSPKVGDFVTVRQQIIWKGTTINSLPTPSFPVVPAPLVDRNMPTPVITDFLYECETGVPLAGLIDGVNIQLQAQHLNTTSAFAGNSMWCATKPLTAGDMVTARQFFVRPNLSSLPSSPYVYVGQFVPPPPDIHGPLCLNTPRVTIGNLNPGNKVVLYAGRASGGSPETAGPWRASIKSLVQSFPLPSQVELRGTLSGPPEFLYAHQEDCKALASSDSPRQTFIQLPPPPTPSVGPLYQCARKVRVSGLLPATSVVLTSDSPTWPLLSDPVVAEDAFVDIVLKRELEAGETITATATGCSPGEGSSAWTKVLALGDIQPPRVHNPTYQWQTSVSIENCTPGAHVQVYVNGTYRGGADAVTDTVLVPVGSLLSGGLVTARQSLCTQISGELPGVPAVPGWIGLVTQSPPSIGTGPGSVMVTITAYDAFDKHEITNGQVFNLNNSQVIGPTSQAFAKAFPFFYNANNEPFGVRAPGYNTWPGPGTFNVKDPAPTADFAYLPQALNLQPQPIVAFFDQSKGAVNQWDWDFGDGTPHGNTRNPQHQYKISGLITVNLTVKGPTPPGSSKSHMLSISFPSVQPPTDPTAESIELFFCPVDLDFPQIGKHNSIYIYVEDITLQQGFGQPVQLKHGYIGNVCPVQGSPSHKITLADGHRYHIVCVDPDNCGGQNDPTNSSCIRWELIVMGKKGSGAIQLTES